MARKSDASNPQESSVVTSKSNASHSFFVDEDAITGASRLTIRESVLPLCFLILACMMLGFAGGVGDVLAVKFQKSLNVSKAKSMGFQAASNGYEYPQRDMQLLIWS